jgi:UrcA family protein
MAFISHRLMNERRAIRAQSKGVNMSKLLLAATAALLLAGPALAQAQEAAPSQVVSTRGVDFSDAKQVHNFYNKLWRTAYAVCDSNSVNPRIAQADLACVNHVLAQAVQKVDAPSLTAMLDNRMGGEANVFQAAAH